MIWIGGSYENKKKYEDKIKKSSISYNVDSNADIFGNDGYYLTNYVKEDGDYGWAAIRGESNYDWFYNASGKWSPDSI